LPGKEREKKRDHLVSFFRKRVFFGMAEAGKKGKAAYKGTT